MTQSGTVTPTETAQATSTTGPQFSRTGIVAVDANAATIPVVLNSALSVATVAALCNTASESITLRLIYFNSSSIPCGCSVPITFTSGAKADFGSLFMGVPNSDFWRPLAGATSLGIKVDSLSAGKWSVYGTMG